MKCPITRVVPVGLATALASLALAGTALAAAPSNDTFANATTISSLPFSDTVDTTGATTDSDDHAAGPACGVSGGPTELHSVWYDYTPSSNQNIRIDTSGSSYGVGVAVLTGSPDSFSAVSCFLGSNQVPVLAGQTYHILVVDFSAGTGGTLHLSVSEIPPLEAHFTIDRFGSFDPRTGSATVRGTATCSSGAYAFVGLNLAQPVGGSRLATITGSGGAYISSCDGSPHPWSAEVQPATGGRFVGGHASVSANFGACNGFDCKFESAQQDISLRR
jgi:hypothetical protein